MRIVAFRPDYNEKLAKVVECLAKGIPDCKIVPLGEYVECDIAIVFGGVKDSFSPTWPKREILEKHKGRRLIMIESGFFNRGEYYQVGWGGYAGTADFNNDFSPPDRWESFGVELQPWQHRENGYWVVMGQVPWDTQVQEMDHPRWCRDMCAQLDAMGRKVIFRPHPRIQQRDDGNAMYGVQDKYIVEGKLASVLKKTACVVTWNSTSAVDALIAGIPVVTCHESSIAWGMGNVTIENMPIYPDREQFFYNMGYAMWTLDEMKSGQVWEHLNK